MAKESVLSRATFVAAGMLMASWVGGTAGISLFKTVYRLISGAWPNTALYGLAPGQAIAWVLGLPADGSLRPTLLVLLDLDIMAYIVLIPPLLLLPCLVVLLAGHRQGPILPFPRFRFPSLGRDDPMTIDPIFRRGRGLAAQKQPPRSTASGTPG